MKKKRRLKKKYVIFLYVYFIIFLSYFTTNTLSKYFVVLPETTADMNVAKWEVYADTSDNAVDVLDLVSGGNTNQNYIVKVTSSSDVAVDYAIEVSSLPTGVTVLLDGNNSGTISSNKVVFENAGSFNAGSNNAINEHTLTFSTALGSGDIDSSSVKIDVIFTQINPND